MRSVMSGLRTAPVTVAPLFVPDEPWMASGSCAQTDPEAFFPEKGGSTRAAKIVCAGCDVRPECLNYALTHNERFGIWGGLSEKQRRRMTQSAA